MACENCGCPDHEKPMCFRGERWCSDKCRKELLRKEEGACHPPQS